MPTQFNILIVNGPNLNLLGQRVPELYGTKTLQDIEQELTRLAASLKIKPSFVQSNHEGELINAIQGAWTVTDGLIINPGGYGHTSIALRDAVADYPHPVIEVHLSNIYAREAFRHHSYLSAVVTGVICGLGPQSYSLALQGLHQKLSDTKV